jgi:phage-related protein
MADEIDINLGSFSLDTTNKISIADFDIKLAKAIAQADLPKTDGSVIPIGRKRNIAIKVKGVIIGTNYDNLRSNLDALKAALESDAEQQLTFDDDRFIRVQYTGFSYSYRTLRTFADFSFDVIAQDPFWYAASLSSDDRTPTSTVAYNVTNSGNAPTRVKVTITKTGSGSVVDEIKFENVTTGEMFQYRGTLASGDDLVVNNRLDQLRKTVLNDGANAISDFEGDFITLDPGVNSMKFTGASGIDVLLEWRSAYH